MVVKLSERVRVLRRFHAVISLRFSISLIHSSSFRRMIQLLISIRATATRWAFHKRATAVLSSQYFSTTRSTSSETMLIVRLHRHFYDGLDGLLRTGLPIGFSPGHARRATSSSRILTASWRFLFVSFERNIL